MADRQQVFVAYPGRDADLAAGINRMVLEFTMLNQGKVVSCAISTAAMDDLEGRRCFR
jgi:hypothetical protein